MHFFNGLLNQSKQDFPVDIFESLDIQTGFSCLVFAKFLHQARLISGLAQEYPGRPAQRNFSWQHLKTAALSNNT
jgi:hypothetical protein